MQIRCEFEQLNFYLAPKDKIIPNTDKNNQMGTFINLRSQCFKTWLWIPFTMINYLHLNSALAFVCKRSAPFDK